MKRGGSFVEEFYGVPWDAIEAFDLVINTGKIPPDLAMNWGDSTQRKDWH